MVDAFSRSQNQITMKARILTLLLLVATVSYADNAQIVIKQKSGSETILELSTHPVITFSGEDMVVTTDLTTFSIPLDFIEDYVVSDGTTDIEQLVMKPQLLDGSIAFNGLAEGTPVYVYSMDGRLITKMKVDQSSRAVVSLQDLPKGVYIVSAGNNKVKVMNK